MEPRSLSSADRLHALLPQGPRGIDVNLPAAVSQAVGEALVLAELEQTIGDNVGFERARDWLKVEIDGCHFLIRVLSTTDHSGNVTVKNPDSETETAQVLDSAAAKLGAAGLVVLVAFNFGLGVQPNQPAPSTRDHLVALLELAAFPYGFSGFPANEWRDHLLRSTGFVESQVPGKDKHVVDKDGGGKDGNSAKPQRSGASTLKVNVMEGMPLGMLLNRGSRK